MSTADDNNPIVVKIATNGINIGVTVSKEDAKAILTLATDAYLRYLAARNLNQAAK